MTELKTCTQCLMDESDPLISFNENGVCNYCVSFKNNPEAYGVVDDGVRLWKETVEPFILRSKKGKYDSVIGISGGIDSSYLAYLIKKKTNLTPLLVHAKNDVWDSEISKRNLKRVLDYTGFDIEYPTVDMNEYVSLQRAYFYASVIDTDVPADYLIEAFIRNVALKHKIQYVLSGGNYFADAFMPYSWTYANKLDRVNMMNIYKLHGDGTPLRSFPKFGAFEVMKSQYIHKLKYRTPLNYFGYNRFAAIEELEKEIGYEMYADKHGENIFTRFYQNYILPEKFGVDKRKANYSNYIRSGGITRSQGLAMLSKPLYDAEQFEADKKVVLSTLHFSEAEFNRIMQLPVVSHSVFDSDDWVYSAERHIRNVLRMAKSFLTGRYLNKIC